LTDGGGEGKPASGMARKLRVQYPGAIYHVMNRGDRREAIFIEDEDRYLFLETLGEACEKTDWRVDAWCLMSNHFHLVTETPRGDQVTGMQCFLGVYTNRFNPPAQGIWEPLQTYRWSSYPSYLAEASRRESLYKALSGEHSPDFDTVLKVIEALGLRLHAEASRG
jgi:REP element-mobilizing transposase RayT